MISRFSLRIGEVTSLSPLLEWPCLSRGRTLALRRGSASPAVPCSRRDLYSLQVSCVVQPGDGPFSPAIHGQLGEATAIKAIGHSGEIGCWEPEPPVHHGHHSMTMRHDQHRLALDTSHHPLHPHYDSACHHPPAFRLWIGPPVDEGFRHR